MRNVCCARRSKKSKNDEEKNGMGAEALEEEGEEEKIKREFHLSG